MRWESDARERPAPPRRGRLESSTGYANMSGDDDHADDEADGDYDDNTSEELSSDSNSEYYSEGSLINSINNWYLNGWYLEMSPKCRFRLEAQI